MIKQIIIIVTIQVACFCAHFVPLKNYPTLLLQASISEELTKVNIITANV